MKYDTLIVDGPYLSHRSFCAPFHLTTKSGLDSTMMHTFMASLKTLKTKFEPNEIIFTWESHGTPSWRRAILPTYKPSKDRVEPFIQQIKDLQMLLYLLGYKQWYSPSNEADDVIATLSKGIDKLKLIFTVDKDIMQVINPLVHIYTGKEIMVESKVKDKYGVYPHQIPDLLAIMGDSADNIDGIKGYGPKKALEVLKKYGFIEKISNDDPINVHRVKLLLNKRLTQLNKSATLEEITFDTKTTINDILDKYELKKIKENIKDYKLEEKTSLNSFF